MIDEERIAEFEKRFYENQQLYRFLPDTENSREQVEKSIARVGLEVFGPDWPEFANNYLSIHFNGPPQEAAATK